MTPNNAQQRKTTPFGGSSPHIIVAPLLYFMSKGVSGCRHIMTTTRHTAHKMTLNIDEENISMRENGREQKSTKRRKNENKTMTGNDDIETKRRKRMKALPG